MITQNTNTNAQTLKHTNAKTNTSCGRRDNTNGRKNQDRMKFQGSNFRLLVHPLVWSQFHFCNSPLFFCKMHFPVVPDKFPSLSVQKFSVGEKARDCLEISQSFLASTIICQDILTLLFFFSNYASQTFENVSKLLK